MNHFPIWPGGSHDLGHLACAGIAIAREAAAQCGKNQKPETGIKGPRGRGVSEMSNIPIGFGFNAASVPARLGVGHRSSSL